MGNQQVVSQLPCPVSFGACRKVAISVGAMVGVTHPELVQLGFFDTSARSGDNFLVAGSIILGLRELVDLGRDKPVLLAFISIAESSARRYPTAGEESAHALEPRIIVRARCGPATPRIQYLSLLSLW